MPASRSGDPRKKAAAKKTTSRKSEFAPTVWGADRSEAIGSVTVLDVPSGQRCRVRRPGVPGLIKAGILESLDTLSSVVHREHVARADPSVEDLKANEKTDEEAMQDLMNDPEKLDKVIDTIDKVICYVVIEPEVHPDPPDGEELEKGKIYAQDVEWQDKMFIMQFAVGGSRDLERFRGQIKQSTDRLANGRKVSVPSK